MKLLNVQIPKIVMQTWKNIELPVKWQASQDSIKKYLHDWKYVLMTDEMNLKFVKKYFPDFLKTYENFEYPIQRADAIRYLWFYVNGGLYMDLDIELLKPIDCLFYEYKDVYVIKSMYSSTTYTNSFMASQPKSILMLKCVSLMHNYIQPLIKISKHFEVINTTGPNMFTKAIEKTKLKYNENFNVCELPSDLILTDKNYVYDKNKDQSRYAHILGGSSWSSYDTEILLFAHYNKKELSAAFLALVIILIILTGKKRLSLV